MADSTQEKTEQATPRKLQKAREEGQVARSMELNSVVIVSLGVVSIYLLGPLLFGNLAIMMRQTLSQAPKFVIDSGNIQSLFTSQLWGFTVVLGPILLVLAVISYLINVVQVGPLFSAKALQFKSDRFNLVKGFQRLISKRSLIELIRDVIKTIVIAIVAYKTIAGWVPTLLQSADLSVGECAHILGRLSLILAVKISVVLLVLALFDFAFQRYDMASNLKMTRQEIREEYKDMEGSPQIKSRIRQIQRDVARQRMMAEIPKADVVITNPTHLAVALKYDAATMPAPLVVAKGQRLIAEKIKEIAREHDIPIVENKPLAQSLFKLVEAGAYIPATLYRAVAEVLAYIYRLREKKGIDNG